LAPLVLCGQDVALAATREATLWAQRQLVQMRPLGGAVDSALQSFGTLEISRLTRHESQRDNLPGRQEPQRGKVSGSFVIVLEKIPVHLNLIQQHVRDWLVTALRCPSTAEVSTAHMQHDLHCRGTLLNCSVDELGVDRR